MSQPSQLSASTIARPLQPWLILAIVLLADIVDLLDATITTIVAPSIAQSLGGGAGLISWLGAIYALSMGILLVPGGVSTRFEEVRCALARRPLPPAYRDVRGN